MQSHGRIRDLIGFADKKHNFEMIVMHYLSEQAYEKALEYLKNVKDSKIQDVVYKYSHIFFRYETEKTVQLLVKYIKEFKPIKLMPGLMNIPDSKRIYGIELLMYIIIYSDIAQKRENQERKVYTTFSYFSTRLLPNKKCQS